MADGEVVLGLVLGQVVIDGLDHGGVELLGAEAVAAADDEDVVLARLAQRGADVQIQRLAQRAGLLGAVQHGDLLAGGRDGGQEVLHGEGAVEVDLDKADLLAALVQVIDGLLGGVAAGAHGDDDAVGVRGAHVVKQLVVAAGQFADFVHDFLDDVRGGR